MHLPSARTASTATSRRRLATLLWGKQPSPPSSSSSCSPSVGQSRSSSSWLAQRRRRPRKYTTDALEWTTGNSTANCGVTSSSSQSAAASARVLPQHSSNSMANATTTTSSHGSVYQMTDSAPSILFANRTTSNTVLTPPPTSTQLQAQFWAAAIPMVGFGFMDNLVMIQAGSYIDMTLGVSLGLATMTAAAAGQVVSDVSGVIFGNTMESVFAKWLPTDTLTAAQRQLPVVGRVRLWGAVVGVTVGCALGALTLLLVDLEAKDKHAQWTQLQDILQDLQHYTTTTGAAGQHHPQAHAHAQFTVHVITHPEEKEHSYFSQNNHKSNNNTTSMIQPLHLHHDNNIQTTPASSVMQACVQTQSTITREYFDDDYDGDERSSTNTTTTVIHYVPIHAGNDVVGVLEYKQQQQSLENHHDHDEITNNHAVVSKDRAELLAGHIGILLNRM